MKDSEEVKPATPGTTKKNSKKLAPDKISLEFMTQVVEAIEARRKVIKPSSFSSSKVKAR
jgi:hypothetical protein